MTMVGCYVTVFQKDLRAILLKFIYLGIIGQSHFLKILKKKECYIIGAPFLFYKEKYQIKKKNKKNTLFFLVTALAKLI